MKTYTVNFKLQSVSSATKPVQLVCSLNTKWEGKYLSQVCSMGVSLLPTEWDASRNLPKSAELAGKFLILKERIEVYFRTIRDLSDAEVAKIYKKGFYKDHISQYIDSIFHGKETHLTKEFKEFKEFAKEYSKNQKVERYKVYDELNHKLIEFNYKIINQDNQVVDNNWFFSTGQADKPEKLLGSIIQPTTTKNNSPSERVSSHEGDEELLNMTFFEFIKFVGRKKVAMEEIGKLGPYVVFANSFEEYDMDVTLGDITTDDFSDFFTWLREQKDYENPSYNNYKKWAKAVLNFAERELSIVFYRKQLNLKSSIFERTNETVTRPYLTEEMLNTLLAVEFDDKHKHLDYPRDLFYISAHTGGLTFVDLHQGFNVQEKKVDDILTKFITVKRQKTGVVAEIPITDEVYVLLEKHKFQFSKITGKHYNDCIRESCRIAGFTDDFVQTRTNVKTKKVTNEAKPFYAWISSHTARRSFCTNYHVHRGIDAKLVMNISQHTTYEAFDSYIQASQKVKFEEFVRQTIRKKENK